MKIQRNEFLTTIGFTTFTLLMSLFTLKITVRKRALNLKFQCIVYLLDILEGIINTYQVRELPRRY